MFISEALNQKSFSWETAYSLALFNQVAYQKKADIKPVVLQSWNYDEFHYFDSDRVEGFLVKKTDSAVVCFRGKEDNLNDWITHLGSDQTPTDYGNVHSDILQATQTIKDELGVMLQEINTQTNNLWFTGHGFGAAVATIAIAELDLADNIAGCYTFGQPRFCDSTARDQLTQRFGEKHFRFVNDDDVVARLPPDFDHIGRFLHFDKRGFLDNTEAQNLTNSTSTVAMPSGPNNNFLSKDEIDELIAMLNHDFTINGGKSNSENNNTLEDSTTDFISGLRAHKVRNYVSAIRRSMGLENQPHKKKKKKVVLGRSSKSLKGSEIESSRSTHTPTVLSHTEPQSNSQEFIPVTLRVKHKEWSPPAGVKINSQIGTVVTTRVTQATLDNLRDDPDILSLSTSRDSGKTECQMSMPFIGVEIFHGPSKNEFGDACLIGVIDTGIDILHEAFLDENGKTRILAFWDQTSTETGFSPEDIDTTMYAGLDYGRLYTQTEIDALRNTPSVIPSTLRDPQAHGTHVSSIAAGRATGSFAGGVAPQSQLIVVRANAISADGQPTSIGYSNSHIEGLILLEKMATNQNKPIVVNVSLGLNAGAHDGKSSLEIAFDEFSSSGTAPGRVIVKSAGNEHKHAGHAQLQAKQNTLVKLEWDSDSGISRSFDYFELWYFGGNDLEFTLTDPNGNRMGPISTINPDANDLLGGNECWLQLDELHPDNGDALLTIQVSKATDSIQGGTWMLEIFCKTVIDDGRIDAWVERDNSRPVKFISHTSDDTTLSIPGTAETVISVAACKPQDPLELTDNSSHGPTRDGRRKPEICAPGEGITAAWANTGDPQSTIAQTGTSMAAPHVSGAIALKMSECHKDPSKRQLNANQFRQLLRRNPDGASSHHSGFGYGRLKLSTLD